jgi:hypothetical protein
MLLAELAADLEGGLRPVGEVVERGGAGAVEALLFEQRLLLGDGQPFALSEPGFERQIERQPECEGVVDEDADPLGVALLRHHARDGAFAEIRGLFVVRCAHTDKVADPGDTVRSPHDPGHHVAFRLSTGTTGKPRTSVARRAAVPSRGGPSVGGGPARLNACAWASHRSPAHVNR